MVVNKEKINKIENEEFCPNCNKNSMECFDEGNDYYKCLNCKKEYLYDNEEFIEL